MSLHNPQVKPLDPTNFIEWRVSILPVLEIKDVDDCLKVDPPELQEGANAEDIAKHAITLGKDKMARALLKLNISSEILIQVSELPTAKQIWDFLNQHFNRDSAANELFLHCQLYKAEKLPSEDLSSFFHRVQKISLQLSLVHPTLKPSDTTIASVILNGLSSEYVMITQSITSNVPVVNGRQVLNLSDVQSTLLQEEQRLSVSAQSFQVSKRPKRAPVTCSFCNMKYHTYERCHKRLGIGRYENKSDDSQYHRSLSSSLFLHKNGPSSWCFDSGATDHMCHDRSFFEKISACPKESVFYGNNSKGQILGKGDCFIGPLILRNVLYVPELARNLISVSQLTSDGHSVSFDSNGCTITNSEGVVILQGKRSQNLYETEASCNLSERELWHGRLAHCSPANLSKTLALSNIHLKNCKDQLFCEICQLANAKSHSFGIRQTTKRDIPLRTIHADVCGPIHPASPEGFQYMLTFTDDATRYCHVFFMKKKSEVYSKFIEYHKLAERSCGTKLVELFSDNGGEFKNREMTLYCKRFGITQNFTTPYTPALNGVAESMNRILWNKARTALLQSGLPHQHWPKAMSWSVATRNVTVHSKLKISPYQAWFQTSPPLRKLTIFGSDCFVKVTDAQSKTNQRASKMVVVGYSPTFQGYEVMNENQQVSIRRDVVIHEGTFSLCKLLQNSPKSGSVFNLESVYPTDDHYSSEPVPSVPVLLPGFNDVPEQNSNDEESDLEIASDMFEEHTDPEESEEEELESTTDEQAVSDVIDATENQPDFLNLVKGTRPRKEPGYYQQLASGNLSVCNHTSAPSSFKTAVAEDMKNENSKWSDSMEKEMEALRQNRVWELVELPRDRKAIGCKWVYRIKEGGVAKSRLVAQGYNQVPFFDYNETFSPVIRFETLRMILALSHNKGYHVHHMDVSTAFLNGDLEEEIFMKQPLGYVDPSFPNHVCKLKKSLYGLKQSPRQWNQKLVTFLLSDGFVRSESDASLFTSVSQQSIIIVAVYVDDILISSSSIQLVQKTKDSFSNMFKMTDLGEIKLFLGIEISRIRDGTMELRQTSYVESVLERYGFSQCKPQATPSDPSAKPDKNNDVPLGSDVPYREAVGSLIYLATSTRPDIAFAVSHASRSLSNPTVFNWIQVKRIFRYLAGTKNHGLSYSRSSSTLAAYADADWGGSEENGKSTTGFLLTLCGGPVSWKSQLQKTVALSSMEAEYMAACAAAQEIIWARRVLSDLGEDQLSPTILNEDNQSCIAFTKENRFHPRTRHINLRYHFIREAIRDQHLFMKYCQTSDQLADILTKPLGKQKHSKAVTELNLHCASGGVTK